MDELTNKLKNYELRITNYGKPLCPLRKTLRSLWLKAFLIFNFQLLIKKSIFNFQFSINLNSLTWAQLAKIQSCKTEEQLLAVTAKELLNLTEADLKNSTAFDVIAFILFIQSELERIIKLFDKIKHNPTSEEKQAGIENLNFGLFGTLDWWAKRMSITHEQAEQTPWIRIYTCMKNDNQTAIYQRKLTDVITKKKNH
jgi:hypothetical protein